MLLVTATLVLCAAYWEQRWDVWTPKPINIPPFVTNVPLMYHAGHVAAKADSAEDVADDHDAAVDEEEDDDDDDDEEEVLVEEDQIRSTVCAVINLRL